MSKWVWVALVAIALFMVGCTVEPVERFEYKVITHQPNGKTVTYTRQCDRDFPNDSWCQQGLLENTRTVWIGGDQQLYCDLAGNLHLRMNGTGEQETFQVIPQNGVTCEFEVKLLGLV